VLARVGGERGADVFDAHDGHVLEEGHELHEVAVGRVASPGGQDDCVFGLGGGVGGFGVDEDGAVEGPVEVR
jgi:hypothetical protein